MSSKFKIKTIIIGLGNIGIDYDLKSKYSILSHCKSVSKSKHFVLEGAVETDKKKRKIFEKIYKKKSFSSTKELLNSKIDFELAIISASTSNHLKIIKSMSSKKYKFCILEKPGGIDFKQFKKILSILKKNNTKVLINYFRNYLTEYELIKNKFKRNNVSYFFYNRGLVNNCSHLLSFCLKNFGNLKYFKLLKIPYFKNNKKDPSFFAKFKSINAFFFNIGLKNCGQNKFLLFDSNKLLESRESFNSFYLSKVYRSGMIKNTYDFNDKYPKKIIKTNNKAQLQTLEKMYKIFHSKSLYRKYYKINFQTYEIIDKIQKKTR